MAASRGEKPRLLFVCGGNTCRSPIAAAIAQKKLRQKADVKSAGIAAYGKSAAPEAIDVLKRGFSVDISRHRPQDVTKLSLGRFDYVIAMDSIVFRHLQERYRIPSEKLIRWDIDDPISKGIEAYQRCASQIEKCLGELLLGAQKSQLTSIRFDIGKKPKDYGLPETIKQLRTDLVRWKTELESGELRGTLLIGIANKAAGALDKLLRSTLEYYLSLCRLDYNDILKEKVGGKHFGKLTMGQALQCFGIINDQLTKCCRLLDSGIARQLKNRRLLTASVAKRLDEVKNIRNRLAHPEDYSQDVAKLESDAKRIVTLIHEVLGDALFEVALAIPSQTQGAKR